MKTIGAFEAKTHLSELLDLVALGERITITRRGAAVADARASGRRTRSRRRSEAAAALRDLRSGVTLGGVDLRELIEQGRR